MEIPIDIVDITMFSYMKLNAYDAWKYVKNLIDTVEKLGGVLSILWHNWTFYYPISYAGLLDREWTRLYEKILKYSYKKNAWITNGEAIADYILKN
jgi:hypothetical protein